MSLEIFNRMPQGVESNAERKIVKFYVGTVCCGVDIMAVREILNPGALTPLPGSPEHVVGAADHRSELVPVVDMRIRLGQEKVVNAKEKWVVVNVEERDVALLVDRVHGVVTVTPADERNRNPLDDRANISWIRRVYGDSSSLLFELDLFRVVDLGQTITNVEGVTGVF